MYAAESLGDASCPQPIYQHLVEAEVMEAMPGMYMVASRRAVEATFKNTEVFSSEGFLELGNVRPLIPLSVDPPRHLKYRKILDPIFAPRQMDAIEDDVTARVNHFIDQFEARGECHFTHEFAEKFPSAVFLGLMGLPWEELDTFLRLKDGIIRPGGIEMEQEERQQIQRDIGAGALRVLRRHPRRAPEGTEGRHPHPVQHRGDRRREAHARGDPRHLLPLLHRRSRHGDRLAHVLLRVTSPSTTPTAGRSWSNPDIIPSATEELLRWETPVPNVPRMATTECPVAGHTVPAGSFVLVNVGAANVDPAEYDDPMDVRFDRDVNRHLAFGGGVHRCLGSHLARRELRVTLREWHRRIPEYSIKPGVELQYAAGLRMVENLELVWPTK